MTTVGVHCWMGGMTGARGPARPTPAPATGLAHLEETVLATQRYLATVNGLSDRELRAPSVLPGWTRAHVVSHVSRNAEALTRLVHWARTGEPTPMYTSQEARDREIDEGSRRGPADLVAEAAETAAQLEAALRGLPDDRLEETVARTYDGPVFPVRRAGAMRRTASAIRASLEPGTRWSTSTPTRRSGPGPKSRRWPESSSTPSRNSTTTPSSRRSSPHTFSTSSASWRPST